MTRSSERTERVWPTLILAGPAPARAARLEKLAQQARRAGETTFSTSFDLARGGPWAGVRDLVQGVLPWLNAEAPRLLERHRYELALVLPELRTRFPLREASLTDAAPVKERVRSFPMDRAYRLVHGLIELLAAALDHRPDGHYWMAFDDFDSAGALGRRFIRELDRRLRGTRSIRLVLGCAPDGVARTMEDFPAADVERLTPTEGASIAFDRERAMREAEETEAPFDTDIRLLETHAPRVIHLWERCGLPERAVRWRVTLLAIYNHFGYYEDALAFGEGVLPRLDEYTRGERAFSRWHVVSGLFNANVALRQPERALELVKTEALDKVEDPTELISIHYALAMLHARFLPQKDLGLAEEHLRASLSYVGQAPLDDADRCYLQAFNWNGLAFIRHLQGKPEEALELCQRGYESLRVHLSEEQHRLHRSVLLYNIAQVHASLRNLPAAIEYYTAAMEIDPRYSEYYNERGGAYLALGDTDLAIQDFHRAIELSAPYPEVWINLGQGYRQVGRDRDAVAAYSRALDLDPHAVLAWIGRAQSYANLGELEEAVTDYREAIARDPQDPQVLSNRGALLYELGRFQESLADLDAAVALLPEDEDLQGNRAIALAAVRASAGELETVA